MLNAYQLMKSMVDAGATGVYFENLLASVNRCGHMSGKALISTREVVEKQTAAIKLLISREHRHSLSPAPMLKPRICRIPAWMITTSRARMRNEGLPIRAESEFQLGNWPERANFPSGSESLFTLQLFLKNNRSHIHPWSGYRLKFCQRLFLR